MNLENSSYWIFSIVHTTREEKVNSDLNYKPQDLQLQLRNAYWWDTRSNFMRVTNQFLKKKKNGFSSLISCPKFALAPLHSFSHNLYFSLGPLLPVFSQKRAGPPRISTEYSITRHNKTKGKTLTSSLREAAQKEHFSQNVV